MQACMYINLTLQVQWEMQIRKEPMDKLSTRSERYYEKTTCGTTGPSAAELVDPAIDIERRRPLNPSCHSENKIHQLDVHLRSIRHPGDLNLHLGDLCGPIVVNFLFMQMT